MFALYEFSSIALFMTCEPRKIKIKNPCKKNPTEKAFPAAPKKFGSAVPKKKKKWCKHKFFTTVIQSCMRGTNCWIVHHWLRHYCSTVSSSVNSWGKTLSELTDQCHPSIGRVDDGNVFLRFVQNNAHSVPGLQLIFLSFFHSYCTSFWWEIQTKILIILL